MAEVKTARMRLVSGTRELAEAEQSDPVRLAGLLNANVPREWPPETVKDAQFMFLASCVEDGTCGPWTLGWYGLLELGGRATLCGSVGFKGSPSPQGVVEIGYAVLPEFQGRGLACEMILGLSRWALGQPGVTELQAEVSTDNRASVRVLEKTGFVLTGAGHEAAMVRYRLSNFEGAAFRP